MNQPKKERFKTSVGGQALMEGIMMRGPKQMCCAVRKPDEVFVRPSRPRTGMDEDSAGARRHFTHRHDGVTAT